MLAATAAAADDEVHPNRTDSLPGAMAEEKGSPLLNLPRELRDIIYGMVFQDCILKLYEKNHKAVPESLDLPTVCKQTYAEAIGIYYRNVAIGWWYFSTFEI
jgi:hypothetical protein